MCFLTVPIAAGYNEIKLSQCGKKQKKGGTAKINCNSLESEGINYRESSIWQSIGTSYYLSTVNINYYKQTKWQVCIIQKYADVIFKRKQ